MIAIPRFKTHMQPLVIPGEGVLILSENNTVVLYGTLYERVVPLIDGVRSADDIAEALSEELDATRVYYTLLLLEQNGHVVESVPGMEPGRAGFWYGLGIDPATAEAALKASKVRVTALGNVESEPLLSPLADIGIVTISDGGESSFDIVATDDYLREELQDMALDAWTAGRPLMLLRPVGFEIWVGPLFVPGETGCLSCLQHKLSRHRLIQQFAGSKGHKVRLPLPSLPGGVRTACELAAIDAAKAIAGAADGLIGKILSLDIRTWASRTHYLIRNPSCPVCGDPPSRIAVPVRLVNRKVAFVEDGGHRTVPPEATLKKYGHLVSPITGIVGTFQSVSGTDGVVHVYRAGHNTAFRLDRMEDLKRGLRNASAGKGASEIQARASALCEALERYCGETDGSEVLISGSLREMRVRYGEAVIHPNAVMRYSNRQYAERKTWNARKSRFNRVPEPFDEEARIDWTPVWSLTKERRKYLPTQLLYYTAKASKDCETLYCIGCSNGNASGNTLEEAVLQGFLELVERDATALWWYNMLPKPGVDIASFGESWFTDLVAHYDTLERDLWALDITSDLGIPSFAAFSAFREEPEERIFFGLGCHLDARIALQRALAEMNQMIAIPRERGGRSELAIEDKETLSWLTTATRANQPYIVADAGKALSVRSDYPALWSDDLLQDIAECRRRIEEQGMEMLVLDQTRPDIGMPVVKVIVPGLRHFWARYAPGRLYDVPVSMGWLDRRHTEDELNPVPIFF